MNDKSNVLPSVLLSDVELLNLTERNILIEGLQGLVKIESSVVLNPVIKVRLGSIISGTSSIGSKSDLGLAGGAIVQSSKLGECTAITGGGKVFHSQCGDGLRNYGSLIKKSVIGKNFVIRSMSEAKEITAKDDNLLQIFSRVHNSELGSKNIIGAHSSIINAVIGDDVIIKDYTKMENVVIKNKVRIGAYVHLTGQHKSYEPIQIGESCVIESHVTIHAGSVIPPNTRITQHSIVKPKGDQTIMLVLDEKFTQNHVINEFFGS